MANINDQVVDAINRKRAGLAFHEEFLNAIFVDGIAFGCNGNETWCGDNAETGEVYPTDIPADCDDAELIANAIIVALMRAGEMPEES